MNDSPWDSTMPVITMDLPEDEARALLVLIEVGAREIRRKVTAGEYPHECQHNIALGVLLRGDVMHANILRVLTGVTTQ